jgi:hypothetical protein
MALPAAIFALVVIGALVAGALFAGTQEQRVAENSKRAGQSFGIADAGMAEVLRGWVPATMNQGREYPLDSVQVAPTAAPSNTGTYGGYVYKLNPNLYLIDVSAQDRASAGGVRGSGARQRLGLITRIKPVQMNIGASLTTQGSVKLSGTSSIDGNDHTPTGWSDCDPPDSAKAGVRNNGGNVTAQGSADIDGNPPVWTDPGVHDSTFTKFGDLGYADLVAAANYHLPTGNYKAEPALAGAACNTLVPTNWGDGMNPNAACGNYFPIIHVAGSVTLNGVQGQGILLVDGDLDVQGSFQYFGIAIVMGTLKTAGGGSAPAHFWGAVLARNLDLDVNLVSGKATLNYSKCAIVQALQNTSRTATLRSRGWAQLF